MKGADFEDVKKIKKRKIRRGPKDLHRVAESLDIERMANNLKNQRSSKRLLDPQDALLNKTLNEIVRVQMAKTQMFENHQVARSIDNSVQQIKDHYEHL